MRILGMPVTAINVALCISFPLLAVAVGIDRKAQIYNSESESICTLLIIINLIGLWFGIFLQKALG